MKRTQYLFCPGPVHVAKNVKAAVYKDVCHREHEFSSLLRELNENILNLFQIKDKKKYHPVVITGSGTAANEAVLATVGKGKKILVISNGEFGDRLYNISQLHNHNTYLLNFGWANPIDIKLVEKAIKKHEAEMVVVVHHETSTGMVNPVEEIGNIAHSHNALLFVDAVSSIGAMPLNIEKAHIAFCSTASGKAIGSFPGNSIVIGKIEEFEKLKNVKLQSTIYLNLYNYYFYSIQLLQTPNTPNVAGFLALNQAIKNILKEGIEKRMLRITLHAAAIRKALKAMNLKFLIDEKYMSNVLTTVVCPAYTTVAEVQEKLKEKKIIIYAGKGELKEKVFQIANIGEIKKSDIHYLIKNLREIFRPALLPNMEKQSLVSASSHLL